MSVHLMKLYDRWYVRLDLEDGWEYVLYERTKDDSYQAVATFARPEMLSRYLAGLVVSNSPEEEYIKALKRATNELRDAYLRIASLLPSPWEEQA